VTQDVDFSTLGQSPTDVEDYFGFDEFHEFTFPDGKTWIKFKVMSEGDRAKFQRMTNKDIKITRGTGDASINADVAAERHELIKTSVVDWNLCKRNSQGVMEPVPFTKSAGKLNLEAWLSQANPKLVDDLELAIRQANPWMQADMTVDEIDKEIVRLNELRDQVESANAGK
jgi:hypothetical protein